MTDEPVMEIAKPMAVESQTSCINEKPTHAIKAVIHDLDVHDVIAQIKKRLRSRLGHR